MPITDSSSQALIPAVVTAAAAPKTESEFRDAYAKGVLQVDSEIYVASFQEALEQTALPPVAVDLAACATQIANAQAESSRNLSALHWALGPEIYQLRQEYEDATRRNYHRALEKMLEHAISRRYQGVYLQFAQRHSYPVKLTKAQRNELRDDLLGAFNLDEVLTPPAALRLNPEFSESAVKIAVKLLNRELANNDALPSADLRASLFIKKNQAARLQIALNELAQQQKNLRRDYNNDVAQAWLNFGKKFQNLSTVRAQIATLKASGISELSLNDSVVGQALFNSAVQNYATAKNDDEKRASLACLQELVAHGAQLAAEDAEKLDVLALSKLLPLGAAPTAEVKAARDKATKQLESRAGIFAWALTLFYRPEAVADSLAAAQQGVALFLMSRELPFSAEQEQSLLAAAAKPKAELGNPGLRIFDRAPTPDERDRLLTSGTELPRLTYGT